MGERERDEEDGKELEGMGKDLGLGWEVRGNARDKGGREMMVMGRKGNEEEMSVLLVFYIRGNRKGGWVICGENGKERVEE